jgi:hypothetical protein
MPPAAPAGVREARGGWCGRREEEGEAEGGQELDECVRQSLTPRVSGHVSLVPTQVLQDVWKGR